MAVISHGLILALLPHGWIHHSPTDSSMDFDKSPSDFGEPAVIPITQLMFLVNIVVRLLWQPGRNTSANPKAYTICRTQVL